MNQEENKWIIQDLIKNLKRNKDAVVFIGNKALEDLNLYPIDENSKEFLNKKNMVKKPKEFWSHYKENIFKFKDISAAEKEINDFINLGCIKTIINLNYTGNIKVNDDVELIELKGNNKVARCMSCGKEYKITEDMLNTDTLLKCECKGKISPSLVMFGDKYLQSHVKDIENAIFIEEDNEVKLNTHCLIFIGVDFEEDYMHEIIESFSSIKNKTEMNDEDTYFTVLIADKDGVSIDYYQPEFATYEDIPGSINRLMNLLKEK